MEGDLNRPWGRGARWYLDVEQKPSGGLTAPEQAPEIPARPRIRPEEHVKLARFALRGLGIRADEEDELGFALVDLVEAARQWNDGSAECSWATFAIHRLKWNWIRRNFIKGKPRRVPEVPLFLQGKEEDDEIERPEVAVEDRAIRQAEARRDALTLLAGLEERERFVLERRFGIRGEAATVDAIGREVGVTREAVRQVERKALRKLRKRARVAAPADPLEALWTRIEG